MSQPEHKPGTQSEQERQTATPSAGSLLDSVFCEGGPMPTASIRLRAFAFLLDFILISAVASIIIWKVALPQSHPAAFSELTEWTDNIAQVGVFLELGHKRLMRKGVDLFDSNNGYVLALALTTLIHEVVIDLTRAGYDPLNLLGLNGGVDFANNRPKMAE